ncbi:MAG: hypothetical protein HYX33_01505 [Actinobacteria bacterium]|nr:hypothetical protein [Actinomycetota bacterium]
MSHHPYPLTAPRDVSNPDASYVDLYNLDRLQQTIDGTYLAGKPLWLTEFGFSTRPVANLKRSVTEAQQALFLADAYRRVRSNPRVKVFTWYFLQDNPNWASGLLRADGSRKPAAAANAFPFAADVPWVAGEPADVARGTSVSMVGQIRLANRASRVTIESRDGSRWRRLAAVTTRADGSFAVRVKAMRTRALRARWSPGASAAGARPVVSTVATVRVRP